MIMGTISMASVFNASVLPYALVGLHEASVLATAVRAWRKRWKYCNGRFGSDLQVTCVEMDSPYVQCCKEKDS